MNLRLPTVLVGFALASFACADSSSKTATNESEDSAVPVRLEVVDAPSSGVAELSQAAVDDWEDPEPEGVQALAETVVSEAWNTDKRTSLTSPKVGRLGMKIVQIVDRTTGLQGFRTGLESNMVALEDRLDRLNAKITDHEIVITLQGAVLFDFDRYEIRADAFRVLGDVVAVLEQTTPRPVRVEGHTDSIGTDAYNQKLSEQRAGSVEQWLVKNGAEAKRLKTEGHGEERPVAGNDTADGRQLNRRVEIVIERG